MCVLFLSVIGEPTVPTTGPDTGSTVYDGGRESDEREKQTPLCLEPETREGTVEGSGEVRNQRPVTKRLYLNLGPSEPVWSPSKLPLPGPIPKPYDGDIGTLVYTCGRDSHPRDRGTYQMWPEVVPKGNGCFISSKGNDQKRGT